MERHFGIEPHYNMFLTCSFLFVVHWFQGRSSKKQLKFINYLYNTQVEEKNIVMLLLLKWITYWRLDLIVAEQEINNLPDPNNEY